MLHQHYWLVTCDLVRILPYSKGKPRLDTLHRAGIWRESQKVMEEQAVDLYEDLEDPFFPVAVEVCSVRYDKLGGLNFHLS